MTGKDIRRYLCFLAMLCLEATALVYSLIAFITGEIVFLAAILSLILVILEHLDSTASTTTTPYKIWRRQWEEMLETFH